MRETKHTGGLMEFHYPKDYKTERTEVDEMRSKSIREYYEKEAIKMIQQMQILQKNINNNKSKDLVDILDEKFN